jgi:hypothetical protein
LSAKNKPDDPIEVQLAKATPEHFRSWLAGCITVGGTLIALLLVAYWARFGGQATSRDPQDWAAFGSYFGGTAGPLLAFLTVVLLVVTLALQIRQLEDSREQLKASKEELKRSHELQATMAEAMRQQAHYATVSARAVALGAALSSASEHVAQAQQRGVNSPDNVAKYTEMLKRKEKLTQDIIDLTDQLDAVAAGTPVAG